MRSIYQTARTYKRNRAVIIPRPSRSYEAAERFHHRDLPNSQPPELWAELQVVKLALARRIHFRRKPRLIDSASGTTDRDWLLARIHMLEAAIRQSERPA